MPHNVPLSASDLERIRAAVAEVETKTSGEIVPVLVERVDDHDEARWRGAAAGAVLGGLGAAWALHWGELWPRELLWWTSGPPVLGATCGYLFTAWEAVARRLVGAAALERRVQLRAEAAFLRENVFATRDRTGILIFVALFEHRAVVLADEGIHRVVPEEEWTGLVDELIRGLRAGRLADALCEAIARAGGILERFGVEVRPVDEDELSNELRQEES